METDTVLIKIEPEEKITNEDGSNIFQSETSHNFVKIEGHLQYLPTNFSKEEITTSFNCKSEPADSFSNENAVSHSSHMEINDIFDDNDRVNLSKLKQLLTQAPKRSKIKHEEFQENSFIGHEPSIKKEKEEYDMSEETPAVCETNNFKLEGNQINEEYVNIKQELENSEQNESAVGCDNSSVEGVENLVKQTLTEANSRFECVFCLSTFKNKISLHAHFLKNHENHISINATDIITSKIHSCPICQYKTMYKSSFDTHIQSHKKEEKKMVKCGFCPKIFTKKISLDDHLLKQHKELIKNNLGVFITRKIHKCPYCSYETTETKSQKRHIRNHKEYIPVFDDLCEKKLQKCPFCPREFARKISRDDHLLKYHKHTHENVESYVTCKIHRCRTCQYETTEINTFKRHLNYFCHASECELASKKNC